MTPATANDNREEEQRKLFVQSLSTLRTTLESLDNKARLSESAFTITNVLTSYGKLVRSICQIFQAGSFSFYKISDGSTTILDGILPVRELNGDTTLHFLRLPLDLTTLEGYVLTKAKLVNLSDIYAPQNLYPEFNPKRNKDIDARMGIVTKEVIACPIIDSATNHPNGVIVFANHLLHQPFSKFTEKGLNAFAVVVANSLRDGFLSLLFSAFRSLGKASYVLPLKPLSTDSGLTSVLTKPTGVEPTSGLRAADFVEPAFALNVAASQNEDPKKNALEGAWNQQNTEDEDEGEDEDEYEDEGEDEENLDETQDLGKIIKESAKPNPIPAKAASSVASDKPNTTEAVPEDGVAAPVLQKPIKVIVPKEDGVFYKHPHDYLIQKKIITEAQLAQANNQEKKELRNVEQFLMDNYKVTAEQIGISMAYFYHVPYYPFNADIAKPEKLLSNIRAGFFLASKWLPLSINSKDLVLDVLAVNPVEVEMAGYISQLFPRMRYRVLVAPEIEFIKTYARFFGAIDEEKMDELLSGLSDLGLDSIGSEDENNKQESGVSDNELVRLVNKIILDGYNRGASDIHIEPAPGKGKVRIRFRIDGTLVEYLTLPSNVRDNLLARLKVMADMDISVRMRPQDGKIAMKKFSPLNIELRVATIPTAGGVEDVVMRILAAGEPIPLEKLGILPDIEAKIIEIINKPYGIMFVCGPTGSGKTTTLHSILRYLNTVDRKIWTAEDPVEITQKGLRQVQVNPKAGSTFASTMRAFLRCDPDIIMVGEMRDHETVSTGIEASLTGHLVFSTLHTNSAPEAVIRLLDMGMDPFNFADAVLGILAQRLAKRLCSHCKKAYHPDEMELERLLDEYTLELKKTTAWKVNPISERQKVLDMWRRKYSKDGQFTLYKAVGCDKCTNGYKGRVGLHELVLGSDRMKKLIQQKSPVEDIVALALEEGLLSLKMDGISKILMGDTDMMQVRTVCIK